MRAVKDDRRDPAATRTKDPAAAAALGLAAGDQVVAVEQPTAVGIDQLVGRIAPAVDQVTGIKVIVAVTIPATQAPGSRPVTAAQAVASEMKLPAGTHVVLRIGIRTAHNEAIVPRDVAAMIHRAVGAAPRAGELRMLKAAVATNARDTAGANLVTADRSAGTAPGVAILAMGGPPGTVRAVRLRGVTDPIAGIPGAILAMVGRAPGMVHVGRIPGMTDPNVVVHEVGTRATAGDTRMIAAATIATPNATGIRALIGRNETKTMCRRREPLLHQTSLKPQPTWKWGTSQSV